MRTLLLEVKVTSIPSPRLHASPLQAANHKMKTKINWCVSFLA